MLADLDVALLLSLPSGEPSDIGYTPPKEFRIFQYGKIETQKGIFDFDEADADDMLSAQADHGNRLTMDYEHQALANPPIEAPASARYSIEKRADGLWATNVEWTPNATKRLANKEYLFFSPAFKHEGTHPKRLINMALTNLPATKRMQPLVAANLIQTENPMKSVFAALSLKENAAEGEALSAIMKMNEAHSRLLLATGKDSTEEAIGAITALKAMADRAELLSAELNQVRAEKATAEVKGLLDEAVKDGRVSIAKRPQMEALYAENGIKTLRACLDLLPVTAPAVAASPDAAKPANGAATYASLGISAAEAKVIKATGLTLEEWAEQRQKIRQRQNPNEEL